MSEPKPSYTRAFWVTAAVIGALNLAILLNLRFLTVADERVYLVLLGSLFVLNAPALCLLSPFSAAGLGAAFSDSLAGFLLFAISASFWGAVAMLVEKLSAMRRATKARDAPP